MQLLEMNLRNFRNYQELSLDFDPGVNLIVGNNAQGKTNLLEAISYLGSGKSFRAQKTSEMVRFGADFADIDAKVFAQNREQELLARIDAEQARVRELEAKLQSVASGEPSNATEEELEAYRRAEQAERLAKERAQQIYDQANAVLSDAAQEATIVADDIANLTDKLTEFLSQYRTSAQNARDTFQKAAENLQNTDK